MNSFFFFSSRRRHTRSLCDWSSDVCSSDLGFGEALESALSSPELKYIRAGGGTALGSAGMKDRPESSSLRSRALVALAVLAPALGGSTELWARGALLLATAATLLAWPPRHAPGRAWLAVWAALTALALTAVLPGGWFPAPAWRRLFTESF